MQGVLLMMRRVRMKLGESGELGTSKPWRRLAPNLG